MSGSEYCSFFLRYKERREEKRIIIAKKRYSGRIFRNYYLSNTIENKFNKKRIGSKADGRYIIAESSTDIPDVVEIIEISDSVLVTRLLPDRLPIKFRAVM